MIKQNITNKLDINYLKSKVLDESINAIAIIDLNWDIIYVNKSFLKFWHYNSFNEVIGQNSLKFGGDRDRSRTILSKIVATGYSIGEHRFKTREGNIFLGQMSGTLIKNSQDEPTCILLEFVDVTERKLVEKLLIDSEKKYRFLFERSPVALWEMDWTELIQGLKSNEISLNLKSNTNEKLEILKTLIKTIKTLEINQSMLELFLCKNKHNFVENYSKIFTEKTYNTFKHIFLAINTNTKIHSETTMRTLLGEIIYLNCQIFFISKGEGGVLRALMALTDITTLKKQKEELNHFASMIAHDLKTPLQAIIGAADIIQYEVEQNMNETLEFSLDIVKNKVIQLGDMIDNLLEYSKLGQINEDKEMIDINKIVSDVISLFSTEEIELRKKNTLPILYLEKTLIYSIFQNLIENAIKYTDKSKKIICLDYHETDDYWYIEIEDNGKGIAKENFNKIFHLFWRINTKSQTDQESHGIGLATVKRIIENKGGKIGVESTIGKGSKFFFTLPKV